MEERERSKAMVYPPGGDHKPLTVNYGAAEVLNDLLSLAATRLVIGGKLVFFLPTVHGACPTADGTSQDEGKQNAEAAGEGTEDAEPNEAVEEIGVPEHSCFKLVGDYGQGEEQVGGGKLWRRRLITMEKIVDP